jgi:membrane-bound lytic murein transglycosylase D
MNHFFSFFFVMVVGFLQAQRPEVFQRLQDAEDFWYQTTGLQSTNALDTCPSSAALEAFFISKFGPANIYKDLASGYAAFFTRHRCEALSLYEEVAHYQMQQFQDNHYADFLEQNLYLAVYLTGLHPNYQTTNDRKGMWRLSYPVAKKYGLRVDEWVDERLSPKLATQVAWWYYFDLKRMYDQEDLVRLAMATSPTMVEKFVQQSITQNAGPSQLPMEARQLLFELDLLKVLFQPDWLHAKNNRIAKFFAPFVQVQPIDKVSFDVLQTYLQTPAEKIREWNPAFINNCYPSNYNALPLMLTPAAARLFHQNAAKIYAESKLEPVAIKQENAAPTQASTPEKAEQPEEPAGVLVKHTIKPGESLGILAEQYGVRLSDLKRWNNIKGETIFAGQKLKIYTNSPPTADEKPAKPSQKNTAKSPVLKEAKHTVESGETLWKISRMYPGVTPEDIMEWNNLSGPSIYAGQKLVIKIKQ